MIELMPPWVYELVAAVERYEEEHGRREGGWPCLTLALKEIPSDVRMGARVWMDAKRHFGKEEESDDTA